MFEMDKKAAQSIWSQFSHDYRGVDMAVLDGYWSLVLTMWDLESKMFEVLLAIIGMIFLVSLDWQALIGKP